MWYVTGKQRGFVASILLMIGAAVAAAGAPSQPPRQTLSFDRNWRFHLDDAAGAEQIAFDDSGWRPVDLPHDWSLEGPVGKDPAAMDGPFDRLSPSADGPSVNGGYLNGGIGWYRKTFTLPATAKNQRVTILFDGAYMDSDVWLNGKRLGNHPYGYTSFSYDLTPNAKFGAKNVLAVRLNVQQPNSRFYSGAGLYRHVRLMETQPVHLAQWGTFITTPKAAANSATVRAQTQVNNDGAASAAATLTTTVFDPTGKKVAQQQTAQTVAPGGHATFDQSLALRSAQLWSCDTPVLYHAVSEVRLDKTLVDATTTPFGIRTIEFTKDNGFLLNGKRVQIKGVCDHHDLGSLGAAAYRRGFERQLEILKGMGCNAIRTSHYPPSPELLDLCDQMGFLVMDESFDEWKMGKSKFGYSRFFDQWSEPDTVSMVDRDRNHPSIILWSIGNEITESRQGTPEAAPMAKRLADICRREDPSRPVTSACPNPDNAWRSGFAQALDVFGINYSIGAYDKYHGQAVLVASETASQVDSRGEYGLSVDAQGAVQIAPRQDNQVSSYDLYHPVWGYSAEMDLLALKNAPWVAGEFVWSGFDYLGEPTPFSWPSRSSYFGILDLAGFPKDRYYLYKSQWNPEPLVHILPMSWTWPGFEGKAIPVRIFTNADTVELFLNGTSLGTQSMATDAKQLHLEWNVLYAPGELRAVAKKNGQIVATDELHTAGAPAKIMLTPDRAQIAGDGQDLSFVKVTVLDKDGFVCPNAATEIHFAVKGTSAQIIGLDNGDPTNHEPFQGTQHKAFHGLALVVLKSQYGVTGPVTLTATADGLVSDTATVTVAKSTALEPSL